MDFFAFGSSSQTLGEHVFRASAILLLTLLPWLVWQRLQRSRSRQPC
jgi:hypothetical protein